MLTHAQIWMALDRLAARAGLTPSGLAKKAGLDPTTFNRSKRMTPGGRSRWPSTESVAKALSATGASMNILVQLIDESAPSSIKETIPLVALAQAGQDGYFNSSGFPTRHGWQELRFPGIEDAHAYALEISTNALEPVYREGGLIIVSPAAPIRRGDRVVVKTHAGEVVVEELRRRSPKALELLPFGVSAAERTLALDDVQWIARVVWASQ